jgi:hypothetical protein
MDDPGIVRVVCHGVYDMVEATLWLKTGEKDVTGTNYWREEGAESGFIRITLLMNSASSCTRHDVTLRSPHSSINSLLALYVIIYVFLYVWKVGR